MNREQKPNKLRTGGTDITTVDEKNRIVLSANKQEMLGSDFVLYLNAYGFIEAATEAEVAYRVEQLESIGQHKPHAMHLKAFWTDTMETGNNVQASGRLTIPTALARFAKLEKGAEVAVAGRGSSCVIARWDQWEEFQRNGGPILPRFNVLQVSLATLDSVFSITSPMEEGR